MWKFMFFSVLGIRYILDVIIYLLSIIFIFFVLCVIVIIEIEENKLREVLLVVSSWLKCVLFKEKEIKDLL